MYRAAAGDPPPPQPPRAELTPKERRQKDRDSARRARRKGYPVGLTSPTLDRWWGETATTNAPTATAGAGAQQQIATMSGEQAVAFFSRAGLPTGERTKQPRTPYKTHPQPTAPNARSAFSPSMRKPARLSLTHTPPPAPAPAPAPPPPPGSEALVTIWELAKSGRRGEPAVGPAGTRSPRHPTYLAPAFRAGGIKSTMHIREVHANRAGGGDEDVQWVTRSGPRAFARGSHLGGQGESLVPPYTRGSVPLSHPRFNLAQVASDDAASSICRAPTPRG
jgi:hypothetical protein